MDKPLAVPVALWDGAYRRVNLFVGTKDGQDILLYRREGDTEFQIISSRNSKREWVRSGERFRRLVSDLIAFAGDQDSPSKTRHLLVAVYAGTNGEERKRMVLSLCFGQPARAVIAGFSGGISQEMLERLTSGGEVPPTVMNSLMSHERQDQDQDHDDVNIGHPMAKPPRGTRWGIMQFIRHVAVQQFQCDCCQRSKTSKVTVIWTLLRGGKRTICNFCYGELLAGSPRTVARAEAAIKRSEQVSSSKHDGSGLREASASVALREKA